MKFFITAGFFSGALKLDGGATDKVGLMGAFAAKIASRWRIDGTFARQTELELGKSMPPDSDLDAKYGGMAVIKDLKGGYRSAKVSLLEGAEIVRKEYKITREAARIYFWHEVGILYKLRECPYVPKLVHFDRRLGIIYESYCGESVENSEEVQVRIADMLKEMEKKWGVLHKGSFHPRSINTKTVNNVTQKAGKLFFIDFGSDKWTFHAANIKPESLNNNNKPLKPPPPPPKFKSYKSGGIQPKVSGVALKKTNQNQNESGNSKTPDETEEAEKKKPANGPQNPAKGPQKPWYPRHPNPNSEPEPSEVAKGTQKYDQPQEPYKQQTKERPTNWRRPKPQAKPKPKNPQPKLKIEPEPTSSVTKAKNPDPKWKTKTFAEKSKDTEPKVTDPDPKGDKEPKVTDPDPKGDKEPKVTDPKGKTKTFVEKSKDTKPKVTDPDPKGDKGKKPNKKDLDPKEKTQTMSKDPDTKSELGAESDLTGDGSTKLKKKPPPKSKPKSNPKPKAPKGGDLAEATIAELQETVARMSQTIAKMDEKVLEKKTTLLDAKVLDESLCMPSKTPVASEASAEKGNLSKTPVASDADAAVGKVNLPMVKAKMRKPADVASAKNLKPPTPRLVADPIAAADAAAPPDAPRPQGHANPKPRPPKT